MSRLLRFRFHFARVPGHVFKQGLYVVFIFDIPLRDNCDDLFQNIVPYRRPELASIFIRICVKRTTLFFRSVFSLCFSLFI